MHRSMRHLVLATRLALITISLLSLAAPLSAQPAARDAYLDFRNKKPLSDAFRLHSFDPDTEMKPENEGLRVSLPAERGEHFLSEVNVNFHVAGDFEFTATYEILSANPPLDGYGVGVNLTIATDTQPPKYGKLARVLHPRHGSTIVAEVWPKFKNKPKPSDVKSGQLRLARIGPTLHYLASEGPGKDFELLWEVKDYGIDDLKYAGFQVADSGQPGNPVDARLIDLRMRLGKVETDKITSAAPLGALPAPVQAVQEDAKASPRPWDGVPRWILALIGIGALVLVLVLVAVVVLMLMRRRKPIDEETMVAAADSTIVACSSCGKRLKVKPESAGKQLKCPGCGELIAATASRAP